ncbi:MAG: hypothetical protein K0R18_290 [Bacillales bacterium]|jgi:hypothetical protein|nr:hypothetical protein [Bacillales bacterium]
MSTFKKRLAETRNMRKIADGENGVDDKQAFLAALSGAGVEFPGGNEKVLDGHQWQKIGVLDIIAGPLANDFIAVGGGQPQADFLLQKIQEFDTALGEWSNTFYNKLGQETIDKLTSPKFGVLVRNKDAVKGLSTVVNFSQAGSGNKKLSELEDEELEKMASTLVAEFEANIRSLLSSLKK